MDTLLREVSSLFFLVSSVVPWSVIFRRRIEDGGIILGSIGQGLFILFQNENIILKISLCTSQRKTPNRQTARTEVDFNSYFMMACVKPPIKLQKSMYTCLKIGLSRRNLRKRV